MAMLVKVMPYQQAKTVAGDFFCQDDGTIYGISETFWRTRIDSDRFYDAVGPILKARQGNYIDVGITFFGIYIPTKCLIFHAQDLKKMFCERAQPVARYES